MLAISRLKIPIILPCVLGYGNGGHMVQEEVTEIEDFFILCRVQDYLHWNFQMDVLSGVVTSLPPFVHLCLFPSSVILGAFGLQQLHSFPFPETTSLALSILSAAVSL